jgi:hypothetical protein
MSCCILLFGGDYRVTTSITQVGQERKRNRDPAALAKVRGWTRAREGTDPRRLELDVPFPLINECADNGGQHDAARNQVHATSDAGYDWLPLRRLGSVLARRVEQIPAALLGFGGAGSPVRNLQRRFKRPPDPIGCSIDVPGGKRRSRGVPCGRVRQRRLRSRFCRTAPASNRPFAH